MLLRRGYPSYTSRTCVVSRDLITCPLGGNGIASPLITMSKFLPIAEQDRLRVENACTLRRKKLLAPLLPGWGERLGTKNYPSSLEKRD